VRSLLNVLALTGIPTAVVAQSTSTSTSTVKKPAAAHPVAKRVVSPTNAAPPALATDDQKTVYAAGLFVYTRILAPLNLSRQELALVQRAIADEAKGKPAEDLDTWGPKIQPFAQQRGKQVSEAALTKALAEPGAVKTDSGIVYRQLRPGTGDAPKPTDTVKVQYRGTLPNGSEFDSSYKRDKPAEFALDHVIKCWTEGVQKMKVGEKAELVCPANLAYGDNPPPGIPPASTLTFEIELLGITPPTK
jgi:FKBP-type peptidyl-prolyl cis-trans isomerase FkpA